ncbi:hypothetical protein GGX14DRAFT_398699 [Mycena pura]|uniref:Uncharacterized protein n=1 Tax=Mycena pura TaxID=153505 RepID=A0AAD6V6I2_9AGAR|nr:hypothetical protein GGX14DRAFT_398699 [Mycena pura]
MPGKTNDVSERRKTPSKDERRLRAQPGVVVTGAGVATAGRHGGAATGTGCGAAAGGVASEPSEGPGVANASAARGDGWVNAGIGDGGCIVNGSDAYLIAASPAADGCETSTGSWSFETAREGGEATTGNKATAGEASVRARTLRASVEGLGERARFRVVPRPSTRERAGTTAVDATGTGAVDATCTGVADATDTALGMVRCPASEPGSRLWNTELSWAVFWVVKVAESSRALPTDQTPKWGPRTIRPLHVRSAETDVRFARKE